MECYNVTGWIFSLLRISRDSKPISLDPLVLVREHLPDHTVSSRVGCKERRDKV